jgi:LacI family transcriptional regulator
MPWCLAALAARSRPCPQAVSVTGAGDLPLAGSLRVPLTTIRLHEHAVGVAAAVLLLRRLEGGDGSALQTIRILPGLAVRGSTAPPPACPATGGG